MVQTARSKKILRTLLSKNSIIQRNFLIGKKLKLNGTKFLLYV